MMGVEHTTTYTCDNCGREIIGGVGDSPDKNLGIHLIVAADYWYNEVPTGDRGRYQRFDMLVCEACTGEKLIQALAPVTNRTGYGRPWDEGLQRGFKRAIMRALVTIGFLSSSEEARHGA